LLDEMKNGDGMMATLVSDTTIATSFKEAMANVKQVSENASAMAANLEEVSEKMNSRKNAVGVLLADTVFAGKLQTTLDNAQSASYKLDENMEALQHNFLLRGYFKKKKKKEAVAAKEAQARK
jgi:phospholipid/cholesterol/gamma-HCH transport system substrate-binding protein